MFTPEDRTRLRDALIAAARADPRITGAALTGSAAAGAEDRWSGIDLALSVAGAADHGRVVADWTEHMYREGGAVHHVDVHLGDTLFRVSCSPTR
jgi:predicted nucleotidyltransferase